MLSTASEKRTGLANSRRFLSNERLSGAEGAEVPSQSHSPRCHAVGCKNWAYSRVPGWGGQTWVAQVGLSLRKGQGHQHGLRLSCGPRTGTSHLPPARLRTTIDPRKQTLASTSPISQSTQSQTQTCPVPGVTSKTTPEAQADWRQALWKKERFTSTLVIGALGACPVMVPWR